jgi:cysteine desulfurase/selenocysteine lyase
MPGRLDVERVRKDFPILQQEVHGKPLVYLDSAATSQKPRAVLEALDRYYEQDNANVHRGVHRLSERATQSYEAAREKVQRFVNAAHAHEIVFVRGTTEAINLVAQTFGRTRLRAGDEIVVTVMEHHSNIVPWQMLCEEKGAVLRVAPMDDDGTLLVDELDRLIGPRTKLLALGHVSNALGSIHPVRRIVELAHRRNVSVLLDGAQAVPHLAVDVQALGCDFYAFSGHKLFGPTGIGVLYGRSELLEEMPPWQGGGDMISSVSFEKTTYNKLPYKFEAGTPDIAGAIGLGAAIDYVRSLGRDLRARARPALPCHQGAARRPGPAAHRHREGEGQRALLRARRHPPPRRRDRARPRRDRHPHRPPLRAALDAAPGSRGHRARLARPLQHPRGRRRPGRGPAQGPGGLRVKSELRDLYQEVVIDHSKNPRNFRKPEGANRSAEGMNPLCGDEITVHVKLAGDVIQDIGFQGAGCAISKASASMMTAALKNKTKAEAEALFERVHSMLTEGPKSKVNAEELGKLAALSGVWEFPVRVKCASLAWHTLRSALHGSAAPVSTE